jgi:hypothetical protein
MTERWVSSSRSSRFCSRSIAMPRMSTMLPPIWRSLAEISARIRSRSSRISSGSSSTRVRQSSGKTGGDSGRVSAWSVLTDLPRSSFLTCWRKGLTRGARAGEGILGDWPGAVRGDVRFGSHGAVFRGAAEIGPEGCELGHMDHGWPDFGVRLDGLVSHWPDGGTNVLWHAVARPGKPVLGAAEKSTRAEAVVPCSKPCPVPRS